VSVLGRLDDPLLNWYAYLTISGTPYVISSQALPAGWLAVPYVNLPVLDVSRGISTDQPSLDRKAGVATPRSMTLRIGPKQAPVLRKYLSPEAASWRSRLDADFDYAENTNLECTVGAGPTPTDWVYIGGESVRVTGTDAAGYTLGAADRAQLGSVRGNFRSEATKYITDQPEIFEGRIVHVWIGLSDAAGTPLDAALYGANQWEVFAGKIKSLEPGEDFETWVLSASSLEACLSLSVGAEEARGHLHVYATDSALQGVPATPSWDGSGAHIAYVLPGQNFLHLDLSDSGAATAVTVVIPTGFHADIIATISDEMNTQINLAAAWNGTWYCKYMHYTQVPAEDDVPPQDIDMIKIRSSDAVGPATATIEYKTGSILATIGYLSVMPPMETLAAVPGDYDYQWSWHAKATALLVPADAPEILAIIDEPDKWTAPGYVRLGDAEDAEVAAFDAIAPFLTGSLYTISLSKRGALGTQARDVVLDFDELTDSQIAPDTEGITWLKVSQQVQIRLLAGAEMDIYSLILSIALSTGTPGTRGAFDIAGIPKGFGGALDPDMFDLSSFVEAEARTRGSLTTRAVSWQAPQSLSGWISHELAFLGYTMQARRLNTGRYKLTLDQVQDPLMVSARTLTTDDIAPGRAVKLKRIGVGITNAAYVQVMYDSASESFKGQPWLVNDVDSQERYGKQPAASYQAKGLAYSLAAARVEVETQILGMLSRYGRPYEILTVATKRALWVYQPGDQVAVTLPMLPAKDGTKGWTSEPCIVLSVGARYIGKGKSPAATLRLIHFPRRRMSYYVPSAEVTGWNAITNTLTLAANTYSAADRPFPPDPTVDCQDVRWFAEEGAKILIADEGDELNQELLTIAVTTIGANTIQVTAPPALVPGVDTVIYYPAYDDCSAAQKLYIHLAGAAATLGAAGDEAQEYMG